MRDFFRAAHNSGCDLCVSVEDAAKTARRSQGHLPTSARDEGRASHSEEPAHRARGRGEARAHAIVRRRAHSIPQRMTDAFDGRGRGCAPERQRSPRLTPTVCLCGRVRASSSPYPQVRLPETRLLEIAQQSGVESRESRSFATGSAASVSDPSSLPSPWRSRRGTSSGLWSTPVRMSVASCANDRCFERPSSAIAAVGLRPLGRTIASAHERRSRPPSLVASSDGARPTGPAARAPGRARPARAE